MGSDVRYAGSNGNYRFEYYNHSDGIYKQFMPYTDKEYAQLCLSIANNVADAGPYFFAGTMAAPVIAFGAAEGLIAAAPTVTTAALPYITSTYMALSNPATKEFIADVGFSIVSGYDGPGVSSPIAQNITRAPYEGVREASKFLKSQGVIRRFRKPVIESFEIETITLQQADFETYGLRFYGDMAKDAASYLFPTFTNYVNRNGLAILPEWRNSMTGLAEFKVQPGAFYLLGRASAQSSYYRGGVCKCG